MDNRNMHIPRNLFHVFFRATFFSPRVLYKNQMNQQQISLKWSDGSVPERSPRRQKQYVATMEELEMQLDTIKENSAYLQALKDEDFAQPMFLSSREFTEGEFTQPGSNEREEHFRKIVEREQMGQIGRNPFLEGSTYADIVGNHLLTPVATHFPTDKSSVEQPASGMNESINA